MSTTWRLLLFGIVVCAAFLLLRGALYHLPSVSPVKEVDTAPNNEINRPVNHRAKIGNVDPTESTDAEKESSDLSKGSQGYLLVVDYEQQLIGAFLGFYHLASLTSLLNLSTVEPYVQGRGLQGAPAVEKKDSESQVLKLSSFYDLGHLRDALRKCANSDLVSFEDFVSNASRNVVLVSFLPSIHGVHFPTDGRPSKIVEIENATSNQLKSLRVLNTWVSFVTRKESLIRSPSDFRVSRVVLVDARPLHPLPLSDLVNKLGSVVREQVARFGSATVILDRWRDIQLDIPSSYFYFIPEFKWRDCEDIDTVKHSEMVINAADKFRESLNKSRPVVGVHIRAERLLRDFKGNVSHYIDCLLQLTQILRNGTIANVDHGSVHVLHDLGRYGSTSCENRYCKTGRSQFLSALNRYFKKNVVSFDPGNFRPSAMQGAFAAFVEQEYLSTVDVLVTVARGEYQDHTVQRFLKRSGGRRDNLYRICHNPPPLPECYPNC